MEHRKHCRFPVQFHTSFSSVNHISGEGTIGDLSIGGCRIFSLTNVRPATALELRIIISSEQPPLHVNEALVRWFRDSFFGVEFVSLVTDQEARLHRIVRDLEAKPN